MENPPITENLRKPEFNPLRPLFKKWDMLSKNLKQFPAKAPILLPDLFVSCESGADMHTVILQLTDHLLQRPNLMSFYGDVYSFESPFHYCRPEQPFSELFRLMDSARSAAGFRNHFKGIVHLNVDEWIGHHEEQYFAEFLTYLSENSANWMIVLSVTGSPKHKKEIEELRSVCAMFLRIETVQIKLPGADYYLDMLKNMLAGYGVYLTLEASAKLLESVKVIRKNKYFSGTYNIGCFADDVVYTLYSRSSAPKTVLAPEDVEEFGADSDYIKRTIVRMEKKNSIGFGS